MAGTAFKTTKGNIYKSTDVGTTWSAIGPSGSIDGVAVSDIEYVAFDHVTPRNANKLTVAARSDSTGTWQSWILNTTNGGGSWDTAAITASAPGGTLDSLGANTTVWGSFAEISGGGGGTKTVAVLSSTKIVTLWRDEVGDSSIWANVATISGDTITPAGTSYKIHDATAEFISLEFKCVALDSNTFVVGITDAFSEVYIKAATVAGTVVSEGATVGVSGAGGNDVSVARLSDTKAVVVYGNTSDNPSAKVATVSGETVTLGSETVADAGRLSNIIDAVGIDSGSFFLVYRAGGTVYGIVGTVSGTAITFGTEVSGGGVTSRLRVVKLSSTVMCIGYQTGAASFARVATLSGTTVTWGNAFDYKFDNTGDASIAELDSNHVVVSYESSGSPANPVFRVGTISAGTSITYGAQSADISIPSLEGGIYKLSTTKAIFAHTDNVGSSGNALTVNVTDSGTSATKILDVAVYGGGLNALATYSDGTNLQMSQFSLATLTELDKVSLGQGTYAQTASNTWVAFVKRPESTGTAQMWIYGRMDNPAGGSISPVHILRLNSNGTFDVFQSGWGTDWCGGVFQKRTINTLWNIRNFQSGQAGFYNDKAIRSSMPFNVHPKAFYMPANAQYAIVGASAAGGQVINYSVSTFTRWYDVTTNYPNAASSNSGAITGIAVV